MINVSTIEQLYAAVRNPANEDETIVLEGPHTYTLFDNGSEPRGRLELQKNMSLIGKKGNPAAVKIDTSLLLDSSFRGFDGGPQTQRTGAIRIGRGSNSISWLTILGNPASASGIETDLPGTEPTQITVARVVSEGSSRGLDVRNFGTANAQRRIDAVIIHNDFSSGNLAAPPKEAIRLVNFIGADHGEIHAVLRQNTFHDSFIGLFAGNNKTSSGLVDVRSNGDTYKDNSVGCVIVGASVLSPSTTDNSSTSFFAARSHFIDNTKPPSSMPGNTDFGGIVAVGADVSGTGVATGNRVRVRLSDCEVKNNQNKDFEAIGLRLTGAGAGTGNRARIELKGDDGDNPFRVKGTFI